MMDGYDAIRVLTTLVETCREGNFYEDYDHSTELIGEADMALDFLTPMFAGATALRFPRMRVTPEMLARHFHEQYERMAPTFGYKTRKASAVPWGDVPEGNRRLMMAVAASVLLRFMPERMAVPFEPSDGAEGP